MKSYFISGTDTDIGKTIISAGLARAIRNRGIDVGVMKPFAAGIPQKSGFKSEDVEFLAKSAHVNDPENLINPQFFSFSASPYTAAKQLGVAVQLKTVMDSFQKLSEIHDMLLVEGMGGVKVPILKNYFVSDLIKDMNLETILVTSSKVGTVNHTLMTCNVLENSGVKISGIIINNVTSNGYNADILKRDLDELTAHKVLGIVPMMEDFDMENLAKTIENVLDVDLLLK